jgi:phosphate transport system substrate-binding protein
MILLFSGLLCLLFYSCTAEPAVSPLPAVSPPPAVEGNPSVNTYVFTRENMPKLDGSTSTAPLAEAVCSVLLGESRKEIADLVQFNKTTTAYYNLMSGYADLLIVGEDNADILAEKERLGFEWEREPFATDAFIFVVNEENPVDSITIDEAKRIYTGEITNWNELGGADQKIIPFQRNSDAGSQNLMEKLVMKGTPMMEAPLDYIVTTMGQLMARSNWIHRVLLR